MNKDNNLKLKAGGWGLVVVLEEGITVFIPVRKKIANARILQVHESGSISVHWDCNYNLFGDFSTELMFFNSELVLDEGEKKARNKRRARNGLQLIK